MAQEQGLAGQGQQSSQQAVQQVVMMLQQGIQPQELLQQGIPAELIEAAMAMIQQQAEAAADVQNPGLAARNIVNG